VVIEAKAAGVQTGKNDQPASSANAFQERHFQFIMHESDHDRPAGQQQQQQRVFKTDAVRKCLKKSKRSIENSIASLNRKQSLYIPFLLLLQGDVALPGW
jgi:alanine racemase